MMIKSLEARGLTLDNYLQHLDEMTDQEIEAMLMQEPDAERIRTEMKVDKESPRKYAEEKRDFGF